LHLVEEQSLRKQCVTSLRTFR